MDILTLKMIVVMTLVGKSSGKPKHGCPFCSAATPYLERGHLYTLGDLLDLHQVGGYIFFNLILFNNKLGQHQSQTPFSSAF